MISAILLGAALAAANPLAVTPASKIEFVGSKAEGKHTGGFKTVTGAVTLSDDGASVVAVNLEIATASLYSDDEKLTAHLKSPDFFDVRRYPKAVFVSSSIAPASDPSGGVTHEITGTLTMHGVSKTARIPAKVAVEGGRVTIQGTHTLDRTAHGMTYGQGKVYNEVPVTFSIVAGK